jgi:two-component system cell cycle sensor histidine kinase/response regulator CckA
MNTDVVFAFEEAEWPVLLVDGSGVICHANKSAINLLGPSLASGSAPLMEIWSPENTQPVEVFLATWEGAPATRVSIKFQTATGAIVSYAASISAYSEQEQLFFLLQLFKEKVAELAESKNLPIDARGAVGDTNPANRQKLDRALQMAKSVSLDFNNALTAVLGHTSLVLSRMEPTHPWRGWLLEVEKAAARAAEIAKHLAMFSQQDKEPKAQAASNLNTLLQRCVEFFKKNPGPEKVTWNVQLESRPFATVFDEMKMQQVFFRILENSVQALQGGGRIIVQTRNVELSEVTQDRNVRLERGAYVCAEISDSGCGIESDVLPRIFEPFFTTKQEGKHRGLGLAWVYGVITNHGGGVAISSQPGVGTSVRVYLPAETRIVDETVARAEDLYGSQTILFVDDDELVLTTGQAILCAYGYDVLPANSGEKALEIFYEKNANIDLVITDLMMPGMSGRELVERIKQFSPNTPVICASGYAWPKSQTEDRWYLQKPFTSQELLVKVKQALSEKK